MIFFYTLLFCEDEELGVKLRERAKFFECTFLKTKKRYRIRG